MFTAEALEKLQLAKAIESAGHTLGNAHIGKAAVALPDNFTVHNIENFLPGRRRMRGSMSTASLSAFVAFASEHGSTESSACFVDADAIKATAILNIGTEDQPGHCDFSAALVLEKTAEYAALLGIHGNSRTQQQIAEWMEDWEANISVFDGAGEPINLKAAITAVRKISIEASRKVGTEVKNLSSERSTLETINADTDANRPHFLEFKCVPYRELTEMKFPLRLSIITGEKDPVLRLHIRRYDLLKEEIAEEFAEHLETALQSSQESGYAAMPVYIGKFDGK